MKYYTNSSTLSGSNVLYGESTDSGFGNGVSMVVLLNLNNDSVLLSKFGIVSDSDAVGVIHPELFTTALSSVNAEPKMGDLIELTEFGVDRINFPKRGATVYQLTEAIDEFQTNALGGHYVWFWKAKRYDYSQEIPSPGPGVGNTARDDNDLIEQIADQNFNYQEDNFDSNDSVYGNY